ncbi:MAG: hypothetical protein ACOCP2_01715 [Halohasta sp.]
MNARAPLPTEQPARRPPPEAPLASASDDPLAAAGTGDRAR